MVQNRVPCFANRASSPKLQTSSRQADDRFLTRSSRTPPKSPPKSPPTNSGSLRNTDDNRQYSENSRLIITTESRKNLTTNHSASLYKVPTIFHKYFVLHKPFRLILLGDLIFEIPSVRRSVFVFHSNQLFYPTEPTSDTLDIPAHSIQSIQSNFYKKPYSFKILTFCDNSLLLLIHNFFIYKLITINFSHLTIAILLKLKHFYS